MENLINTPTFRQGASFHTGELASYLDEHIFRVDGFAKKKKKKRASEAKNKTYREMVFHSCNTAAVCTDDVVFRAKWQVL